MRPPGMLAQLVRVAAGVGRRGEERFRSVLALSSDWYWEQDEQLRFTHYYGADSASPRRRWDPRVVLGKTPWEIPGVEPLRGDWSAHRAQLERREPFRDLVLRWRMEGVTHYLSLSGEPVFDRKGRFGGYRGVTRNVSGKVAVEEALRRNTRTLELAQQVAGVGSWELELGGRNAHKGALQWSEHCFRVLGYEPGSVEPSSERLFERVHPGDRALVRDRLAEALHEGRRVEFEHRVVWPDGSEHVLEAIAVLERRADGTRARLLGTVRDITPQKRALQRQLMEHAVARCLAESPSASAALRGVLQAICEAQGWDGGRFFTLDQDARVMRFRESWCGGAPAIARFNQGSQGLSFERGVGLVGRAWASGEPLWTADAFADARVRYTRLAREAGVHGAFVFPVSYKGGVIGVISISSVTIREPDLHLLTTMSAIGSQLGQFLMRKSARVALSASEARFRQTFELAGSGIAHVALDGRFLRVNPKLCQILGYTEAELLDRPVKDFSHPADRDATDAARAQVHRGELPSANFEKRYLRKDGSTVWASLTVALAYTQQGAPEYEIAVLEDITERKRNEQALQQSERRYRMLFDFARDLVVIRSRDGRVVDVNPTACSALKYRKDELVGEPITKFFDPDELAVKPLRTSELLERPDTAPFHRLLRRKDGSPLEVENLGGPLPDGNLIITMRDVTERRRSEALVMEIARGVSAHTGEGFFRELVAHLARQLGADFVFVGELLQPDRCRIRTLAAYELGDVTASVEYDLEGSPCVEALQAGCSLVVSQGVGDAYPGDPGLKQRGIEGYVGTPLMGSDDRPIGIMMVMSRTRVEQGAYWASLLEIFGTRAAAEIERSQVEARLRELNASLEARVRERTGQLEAANRELESYNSSISHDLRQPLHAISGFAELLRGRLADTRDAGNYQCVGEIEANAVRMEHMIDALLRLSQASRAALRREPVDVAALVRSVLRDLGSPAPLAAEVVLGELPPVQGDPVLLRQVWANLIGNALKYSSRRSAPRVEISGARCDTGVEYTVRDNGVGFDMQHAGRLFGSFKRLPTAAGFEGNGIGLAIVERIVRRHGGSISAESVPGAGASFRFTLSNVDLA